MRTLSHLALAALLMLLAATPVLAQDEAPEDAPERPQRPELTEEQRALFERVRAMREAGELLQRFDTDEDGSISEDEIKAGLDAMLERLKRRLAELDTDENGEISRDEAEAMTDEDRGLFGEPRRRGMMRPQRGGTDGEEGGAEGEDRPSLFDRLDGDENDSLSPEELQPLAERIRQRVRRLLEMFDGDGDGTITADEIQAAREALRAQLQEMMPQRPGGGERPQRGEGGGGQRR